MHAAALSRLRALTATEGAEAPTRVGRASHGRPAAALPSARPGTAPLTPPPRAGLQRGQVLPRSDAPNEVEPSPLDRSLLQDQCGSIRSKILRHRARFPSGSAWVLHTGVLSSSPTLSPAVRDFLPPRKQPAGQVGHPGDHIIHVLAQRRAGRTSGRPAGGAVERLQVALLCLGRDCVLLEAGEGAPAI